MWPYWLLFLVPAFWALTRLNSTPQLVNLGWETRLPAQWRSVFVFLVLMIGGRHEVGGDWFAYVEEVIKITSGPPDDILKVQDPMYTLFNWVAAKSGFGIYLVNILSAVFFSWGLLAFCRAQPRPWLALTVAVPYLIIVVAMGYTRQGAAIGVAMLGMVALGRGSSLQFILWIALAATFHKSAIILVPLAVLGGSRRRVLTLLWAIFAGVVLYVLLALESMDFLIRGYLVAEYNSAGAAIRIAMNALPAALFLLLRKRFQLSTDQSSFWTWMAYSALLFVVLLILSPSSTVVDRVALYWIPLQLFVLSRLPNALGQRNGKNTAWVYAVVAYSAVTQFVWLVYADMAFGWLPYQFYPWVWLWS